MTTAEYVKRAAIAIALFFAFLVALVLAYAVREVLAAIFIAITLGAAIRPVARSVEREVGLPHALAALLVYLGVLLLFAVLAVAIAPVVIAEAAALAAGLPPFIRGVEDALGRVGVVADLSGRLDEAPAAVVGTLDQLVLVPLSVLELAAWLISILFLSLYWLLERDTILDRLIHLAPRDGRVHVRHVLLHVEERLGKYVLGELIVMGVIGSLTLIGLLVLGVRYAFLLALIAALLEAIPIIGPVLSAVPAVIVAFIQSPTLGLAVLGLYVLIQQIEGNLVYPKIQEYFVQVNAFLILVALLIGAELMGMLGAVIAVPAAVTLSFLAGEIAPKVREIAVEGDNSRAA